MITNALKKDVIKMYIDEFMRHVETKVGSRAKRIGQGYSVCCPAHDDDNPSLSIKEASDGKILLNCFAGCIPEEICGALGLEITSLFPNYESRDSAKTEYIYRSKEDKPLYKKVRTYDKQFYILSYSSSGEWVKGLKSKIRVMYNLPQVLEAKASGAWVFLVEGEKDAERLSTQGLVATTPIEGAGSRLHQEYIGQLEGCNVVLLYDEDAAGYKRRDQWKDLLQDKVAAMKVIELPGLQYRDNSGADVSDWLRDGHTTEELLELVQQTDEYTLTDIKSFDGFKAVNIREFLSMQIPEREMLLEPIIPSQGLSLLYSKRGVGKTFLSLSIGYAVAAGLSILKWKCEKPCKVVYVDGEMPAKLMQERLDMLVKGFGVELQDPSYFRLITPDLQEKNGIDIGKEHDQRLIENLIGDAQLLILDNISTLASSLKENEADSWAPMQKWILKLRKIGVSVLLVHHAGKNGLSRGTSKREDALDSVIVLKHSDGYGVSEGASFEVHIEKARGFFGEDAEPFIASLESDDTGALQWTAKAFQDDLYDEVIEGVNVGKSYRQLAKELEVSKGKIEGLVKKAREKGDLPEDKKKK